jgi:hypothetical protein
MQWGPGYTRFHDRAWREAVRVLKPGLFVLNVKDHIRRGKRQPVTNWHVQNLTEIHGLEVVESIAVDCPGMRYGANRHDDDLPEWVVVFSKPTQGRNT